MPTFEFEVKVSTPNVDVPFTRFPFTVSAKDESRARMKLESYVHELQTRLAREALLSQQPVSGTVVNQTATKSVETTLRGRRAVEEADSRLTMTDLVILATAYAGPTPPDLILAAVRERPETQFYSPVGLAARVSRLWQMRLLEVSR